MTLASHSAEPALAPKQPRRGVGATGSLSRGVGSRSQSQVCGFCAEATLRGQVGGGALSVALKTRRAGGKA